MVYSGDKIRNANTAIIIGYVLFNVTAVFCFDVYQLKAFLCICPYVYFLTIREAFYFEITYDEFRVYNYLLPVLKYRYALIDIKRIDVSSPGRRTTSRAALWVLEHNGKMKRFKSGSLKLKDWHNLMNDLYDAGINVTLEPNILVPPESDTM